MAYFTLLFPATFDVRGSVRHSTIHTEKSNKMQQCIKIYYSIFIWSSTCFGRLVAVQQPDAQQPSTYAKPKTASAVLSSWWWAASPETCWASYKYGIINWYTVASCWIFLYESGYMFRLYLFESSSGWSIIYLKRWYVQLTIILLSTATSRSRQQHCQLYISPS
jgi:hypothetical protein